MLTKSEKVQFVDDYKKLLKSYKVVGVVNLNGIPDRLLQSTKNQLKDRAKFVIGRKSLLKRILESDSHAKRLADSLTGTSAIVLSNEDPFVLYGRFMANSLRLAAKPGQVSPEEVSIKAGETSIQPGQTVTDLKSAGIDVQIQKGKVVIAKDRVVAKKGDVITAGMAKALHILEVYPFRAVIEPTSLMSDGMIFTGKVLKINAESTTNDIMICFRNALSLSLQAQIINAYTVDSFIARAYANAMHLGIERKLLDSGIIDALLANAATQAASLGALRPEGS